MKPTDETLGSEEPQTVDFFAPCGYEDDSYEEFVDRVYASYEHPANKKQLGQVFFNKLHKERPDVSEQIRGTLFDPFPHQYIHEKVYDQVRRLWYGEENE